MSHIGLLDSAIRVASQLAASRDLTTRSLANHLLGDLQQLRRELPIRRQLDVKSRSGQ